jgi:hypothetical protein
MMILIIVVTSNLYQGRGYKLLAQWSEASVANEKARALECAYFQ